jgi:NhaA family Na+:H+ antiporter
VSQWFIALVALWFAMLFAGLEPALAGVVIGLVAPASSLTFTVEQWCTRWSALVVLPLFALCACGVNWSAFSAHSVPLAAVTVAVRLLGKIVGISGALWLLSRTGGHLAPSFTPRRMLGAGALCAMGFTVPLLFAEADFGRPSATYGALTLGLLVATVLGGALGLLLLWRRD